MNDSKPTFGKRLKAHENEHPWFWGIVNGAIFAVGTFFVQTRGNFEGWIPFALLSLVAGSAYAIFAATYLPKVRLRREAEEEARSRAGSRKG